MSTYVKQHKSSGVILPCAPITLLVHIISVVVVVAVVVVVVAVI